MKDVPKKISRLVIWLISLFGIILFVNPLRDGLSISQRIVLIALCLLFGVVPVAMRRTKSLQEIVEDEKSMTLLGLGCLMLIYCISESFYYEFFSKEALLAWFAGIISFAFSIILIVAPGNNQKLSL
ncbi:MAG: hypothetical protein JJ953_04720 [Gracilimonas sp.]|uniref:hypothetical protein n=1 Tax=Gracilimonas TaxID=649462 RepID=UPI001B0A9D48|nr:hypothetical protein [Gracilimonas sp.]MBO6585385.1 hypothetical protein [Gracilimonas sp.]MBO6616381.1 hypothetical protein [Gracilimonas sp.]